MDSNLLHKYSSRLDAEAQEPSVFDPDATDDLGCFGWLRGVRERAVMLELRKKSGNCLAINYSFIETIAFDPSEGITITAGATQVRISGRYLNAEVRPGVVLLQGLLRHRVPWVREASQAELLEAAKSACVVERLGWSRA